MKKIKELLAKLLLYSHVKDQNFREILEYIECGPKLPQQIKLKTLLSVDKNFAQIIKGIRVYYSLYGRNSKELINYLHEAKKEGYAKIKDQMS